MHNPSFSGLPAWASEALDPQALSRDASPAVRNGILSVGMPANDPAIAWYEAKGGSNFLERVQVPYTMTGLDTPQYHALLERHRPRDSQAVVVDVGCADGRNTLPFLAWGCQRVIGVEPIRDSLEKLRAEATRLYGNVEDRLLLIQADARQIPLRSGIADYVLAIEALCCLNEAHSEGLNECRRLLKSTGKMFLSDRAWEGALFTSTLYGGVSELLRAGSGRSMWDGPVATSLRTRVFTENELAQAVEQAGLKILSRYGLSVLSVVLGYLRGTQTLPDDAVKLLPEMQRLLLELGQLPTARRAHVFVAEPNHET